jgi:hypothetical protein
LLVVFSSTHILKSVSIKPSQHNDKIKDIKPILEELFDSEANHFDNKLESEYKCKAIAEYLEDCGSKFVIAWIFV